MKRKLVKQGSSTMMISLPSKWIKSNNLEKGSEIDLEEKENTLIIAGGHKQEKKKETTMHVTDDNRHDIRNMLTHLYRRGIERIIIKGITQKDADTARKTANDILLGFEIVDKTNDFLVLENISEPTEEKYEVMLRRVFLIIKETHRILEEDHKTGRFTRLNDVEELKKQQDKHILFCRRIIAKQNSIQSAIEWELLTFLMHIEHKYYYLYRYATEKKSRSTKQTGELLKQLGSFLEKYYDAYFTKDIKKIHDINKARNEFYFEKCYGELEKSRGRETIMIGQIAEIYRMIQIGTSPILGRLLDDKPYF
jgi:phosphate uptake regulator